MFAEILSDESVGVLDGAALPWRTRLGVVDADAELILEGFSTLKFDAVVVGE